jgi:hypothetical protein
MGPTLPIICALILGLAGLVAAATGLAAEMWFIFVGLGASLTAAYYEALERGYDAADVVRFIRKKVAAKLGRTLED